MIGPLIFIIANVEFSGGIILALGYSYWFFLLSLLGWFTLSIFPILGIELK